MDKIAGILLIALLAIVAAVILSYYVVSQPNQASNTLSSTPTPNPTATPSNTGYITDHTFTVYRWWNGNVTLSMLNKYRAVRMTVSMPLLFTYRLNNTAGMAAYYMGAGQGFDVVSSEFEADLTRVTEHWTKSVETVRLSLNQGSAVYTEYAYLFP